MRAREFTINVPINITINGDGEPAVTTGNKAETDNEELLQNPVMVPPLQQQLELEKAALGKESPVIDKILADDDIGSESEYQSNPEQNNPTTDRELLARIKQLLQH